MAFARARKPDQDGSERPFTALRAEGFGVLWPFGGLEGSQDGHVSVAGCDWDDCGFALGVDFVQEEKTMACLPSGNDNEDSKNKINDSVEKAI